MTYNFDELINRRQSDSAKWNWFDEEVLPMWVADMDFRSPEFVIQSLHERIDHGVFGYCMPPADLPQIICDRMARLYDWEVTPDQIVFIPALVTGFNIVCRMIDEPGAGVLMQTPVYPPFLSAPGNHGLERHTAELSYTVNGQHLSYEIDWDNFSNAITDQTRMFLLCQPHNPIGRGFTDEETSRMLDLCAERDMLICSDEIHCDLMLGDATHRPIAAVRPDLADRMITLMSPSKTYNVPGLGCGFAIIQNPELKAKYEQAHMGIVPWVNAMGYAACRAAFLEGDEWLKAVLAYITANRDFYLDYMAQHLPQLRTTVPQSTYLAWIDCRETGIEGNPKEFFIEHGKVAFNDGLDFGPSGEGFIRINLACPRERLVSALDRMRAALATL